MTEKKIRVLVVDDSAFMRKRLSAMINSDEVCEVIATARNGDEALKMVSALSPDVITLDIELPKMDGVTALKYIMSEWPTPVVIVSAYSNYHGMETIKCLEFGAVDIVAKPSGAISLDIDHLKEELLAKVKAAAQINLSLLHNGFKRKVVYPSKKRRELPCKKIVVIGSSTGGPKALVEILPRLKPDIKAGIVIVQHMPEGFTHAMAERFDSECEIAVHEAQDGEPLKQGTAFVAPGGFQLTLKDGALKGGPIFTLVRGEKQNGICPSADITMQSIATYYGNQTLGVVLTGMGGDGTEGLRAIKEAGGRTLAQDAATSIIFGMPKSAYKAGVVDKMVPLSQMADEITRWVQE